MSKAKKHDGPWRPRTTPGGEPARLLEVDAIAQWRLGNLVAIWNTVIPQGTHITYWPVSDEPMKFVQTQTRSEAWVLGGAMVVMIDGVSGCVACDHLRLRPKPFLPGDVPADGDPDAAP
jgi:hypothetical protein